MIRPDEALAQRVVAKVLGREVTHFDVNQGVTVPDLRFDNPDGSVGYVEVVADTSPAWQRLRDVLEKGCAEIPLAGAAYDWFVWPAVTARVRSRLAPGLPELVGRLEAAGELFDHRRLSPAHLRAQLLESRFRHEFAELGIVEMVAGPRTTGTAVAHIALPGAEGESVIDIERLASWPGEFLAHKYRRDVRQKLGDTGAAERHAFVVVTLTSEWPVYHALGRDGCGRLPSAAPELPAEVTHLWLVGTDGADRCVAWLPDRGGWIDYENGPWHS